MGDLGFKLATKQRQLPTVLTPDEVKLILNSLADRNHLIIALLYGSGLRVNECLRLRVQDIDLDRKCLVVRNGKGNKDRQTLLSLNLIEPLKRQIAAAIEVQAKDNLRGVGCAMPPALARKYPNAWRTPAWAFVFPSSGLCNNPYDGTVQELLGHNDVSTTQIYTHVLGKHYAGSQSPLDRLG